MDLAVKTPRLSLIALRWCCIFRDCKTFERDAPHVHLEPASGDTLEDGAGRRHHIAIYNSSMKRDIYSKALKVDGNCSAASSKADNSVSSVNPTSVSTASLTSASSPAAPMKFP